jgi:hypothetical protein
MRSSLRLAGLVALTVAQAGYSQALPCPTAPPLPGYAHNDYANARPLRDALALGFRGAEVDVFLAGGRLMAAHERRSIRPGRSLEALYLEPLRGMLRRCGRMLGQAGPFLLNIEIKESSPTTYDTLISTLTRYSDLFSADSPLSGPVEVVLVGWHPPAPKLDGRLPPYVRLQHRVTRQGMAADTSRLIRLISLDYGKTIGWSGTGEPPSHLEAWLTGLRRARDAGPHRLARVYDVPPDSTIFRLLLSGGVDLIGVKDLQRGQGTLSLTTRGSLAE